MLHSSKSGLIQTNEFNLTWFELLRCPTLLSMQKRTIQRGRPKGTKTFDAESALAFGAAVRAARVERGIAQEWLASEAGVERSHMGKIERGEHLPNLAMVLRIARTLGIAAAELMADTEARLPKSWPKPTGGG